MIIVVAALRFETKEARDAAVAATADVQLATREEEDGCLDYCFASINGLAGCDEMRLINALDDTCAMKHLNHFVVIRMLKMGCERVTVFPQFIDLDASGNGGVGRKTII